MLDMLKELLMTITGLRVYLTIPVCVYIGALSTLACGPGLRGDQ